MEALASEITIKLEDKIIFPLLYEEVGDKIAVPYCKVINSSIIYGELFYTMEEYKKLLLDI